MFKDFLLFVKHPYAAGIIAVIWIGSIVFIGVDETLRQDHLIEIVMINMVSSLLIALIGFRGHK